MSASDLLLTRRRRPVERLVEIGLRFAAFITIAITAAIIIALVTETIAFFREVSLAEFFGPGRWEALFCKRPDEGCEYSIWPLLSGTLLITGIAMLVAFPTGLLTAIYLSEYASNRVRSVLKPALEVLAGVPTVVYGYFALTFVTPVIVERIFPSAGTFNALAGGIVVGVLILPLVSSISEDALRAVPGSLRAGAHALGARPMRVAVRVVVPAALSGVVASFILAASRAIGETMAVTLAAGSTPQSTLNPLESIQTMTVYIVQVSLGDTPQTDFRFTTLFVVGMTLFAITFALNAISAVLVRRFRQIY